MNNYIKLTRCWKLQTSSSIDYRKLSEYGPGIFQDRVHTFIMVLEIGPKKSVLRYSWWSQDKVHASSNGCRGWSRDMVYASSLHYKGWSKIKFWDLQIITEVVPKKLSKHHPMVILRYDPGIFHSLNRVVSSRLHICI